MKKMGKVIKAAFILITILGVSMSASGAGNSASWKEEVLLHDGKKIVVDRLQTHGESHFGQQGGIAKHIVSFSLPGTAKPIIWESKFGEVESEKSELRLLAIDVVGGVPYIVTTTAGCLSYNRWKRPNPPYVFFKFDGKAWQRISLAEFPAEIKEANVVIDALAQETERRLTRHSGPVLAEEVRKMNVEGRTPEYHYLRAFVREPIKGSPTTCEELVYYKGAWVGPGDSIGKRMMDRKSKQRSSEDKSNSGNQGEH